MAFCNWFFFIKHSIFKAYLSSNTPLYGDTTSSPSVDGALGVSYLEAIVHNAVMNFMCKIWCRCMSFLLGMRDLVLRVFFEGEGDMPLKFSTSHGIYQFPTKKKNYGSYVASYLPIPTHLGSTWILDALW